MASSDAQIGANIQRLRGSMTQTELAREMNARGHRWSQPTVVAIEKGERALRFSEAVDLVAVLKLDRLEWLGSDARSSAMMAAWVELGKAQSAIVEASQEYDAARLRFAEAAVAAAELENAIAGSGVDVAARSPEDVIHRARARQELTEPPALYDVVRRLRELYDGDDDGEHQAEA